MRSHVPVVLLDYMFAKVNSEADIVITFTGVDVTPGMSMAATATSKAATACHV